MTLEETVIAVREYRDKCRDKNLENYTSNGIEIDPHTLAWAEYWLTRMLKQNSCTNKKPEEEQNTGSVGIRQTSDSIEFTASGDAQHGYELGITLGKMMMLDYIRNNCLCGNVMTDGVLDILERARKI